MAASRSLIGAALLAASATIVGGAAIDLIIRKGENIAPKEIEDLLVSHRAPNGKHASGQFINEYRA